MGSGDKGREGSETSTESEGLVPLLNRWDGACPPVKKQRQHPSSADAEGFQTRETTSERELCTRRVIQTVS